MSDIIIIGKGPAGISSALYTKRAGIDTTVIGKDYGSLMKAGKIENYYGFTQPISGNQLIEDGIRQAQRLGVDVLDEEVLGISYTDSLTVITKDHEYKASSIILATGAARSAPNIDGLEELEGRGVSYCAVCDAFFYRGGNVAVLGNGEYALHEALTLLPIASKVRILTNGKEPEINIPDEIEVVQDKIASLNGNDGTLASIGFENGASFPIDGLFIAIGVASSTDLARKLGATTKDNHILVDENMATNIPGLFAAGDCTGGLLQISKAVCDGAKAGTQAIRYLRSLKR